MEPATTDVISLADWIQIGVFLVALGTWIYQVASQRKEARELEYRIANKLEIFMFCHDKPKTEQEIVTHIKGIDDKADEISVKKTIYDMLKDETLRYRSNKTFKVRRNKAKGENDEAADGG